MRFTNRHALRTITFCEGVSRFHIHQPATKSIDVHGHVRRRNSLLHPVVPHPEVRSLRRPALIAPPYASPHSRRDNIRALTARYLRRIITTTSTKIRDSSRSEIQRSSINGRWKRKLRARADERPSRYAINFGTSGTRSRGSINLGRFWNTLARLASNVREKNREPIRTEPTKPTKAMLPVETNWERLDTLMRFLPRRLLRDTSRRQLRDTSRGRLRNTSRRRLRNFAAKTTPQYHREVYSRNNPANLTGRFLREEVRSRRGREYE